MTQRRRWTALFAVLLAFVVVALGASPASANNSHFFGSPFRCCGDVEAKYSIITNAGVYGKIEYLINFPQASPPLATLLSVYVLQCDGFGHGCVTIAANKTEVLGAKVVQTSTKPYSPGHVYKTCGSVTDTDGWRLINACTAFST
jgi:hypothetical protein